MVTALGVIPQITYCPTNRWYLLEKCSTRPSRDVLHLNKRDSKFLSRLKKLDYLFMGDRKVHVFTDHRNLLFLYSPLRLEASLGSHAVSKVQRWAMYLSRFEYNIEHIDGGANIIADILTRWLNGYRVEQKAARKSVLAFAVIPQMMPSSDPEKFVSPSQNITNFTRATHKFKTQRSYSKQSIKTVSDCWENLDSYGRCGRTAIGSCRFPLRNNGTQGRRSNQ